MARFMNSGRAAALMPSNPNPVRIVSVVPTTPPSVNCWVARSSWRRRTPSPRAAARRVQPPVPLSKSVDVDDRAVERDLRVVDPGAQPQRAPVGHVGDEQLDLLARERREVDGPVLPARGVAREGVPRARRSRPSARTRRCSSAGGTGAGHPSRWPGLRRSCPRSPCPVCPFGVGQRRPDVVARVGVVVEHVRLDHHVVPVLLEVGGELERQLTARLAGEVDGLAQPLVGAAVRVRGHVVLAAERAERPGARAQPAREAPRVGERRVLAAGRAASS